MRFYTEESTSVIVLLIGLMTVILSNFSQLVTIFVAINSFLVFLYLIWLRGSYLEEAKPTMIGFIPGHFLLLFAFSLRVQPGLLVLWLWTLLVLSTLGYDYSANRVRRDRDQLEKLTMMFLYCIIWCIIIFLFQRLLVNGLELVDLTALMVRLGLVIGGLVWIGIGLFRINRSYT